MLLIPATHGASKDRALRRDRFAALSDGSGSSAVTNCGGPRLCADSDDPATSAIAPPSWLGNGSSRSAKNPRPSGKLSIMRRVEATDRGDTAHRRSVSVADQDDEWTTKPAWKPADPAALGRSWEGVNARSWRSPLRVMEQRTHASIP